MKKRFLEHINRAAFTIAEPQGGFEPSVTIAKKGFTLAEVLITLAVIGVVAAMSVPSLMNNTQNAELHEKWRKAYASIANATNLLMQENGGTI